MVDSTNGPFLRRIVLPVVLACLMSVPFPGAAFALSVGVAWYGKEGMTDRVYEGFQKRMQEIAPDIDIEFRGSLADEAELGATVQRFQLEKQAMVVMRSSGTAYLIKNKPTIPTFLGAGNHPVKLGAMESLEHPKDNMSGVTYYVPVVRAIESFHDIAPKVTSILLLSQSNYISSAIDWEGVQEGCRKFGLRCEQELIGGRDDLIQVMQRRGHAFDSFLLGNQSAALDNGDAAAENAGGKPVFSLAEKPIHEGAVSGLLSDDRKLGGWIADGLVDVLKNGKKIADIPVRMDDRPVLYVNITAARKANLILPLDILNAARIIE